jgi:hypothetical protein
MTTFSTAVLLLYIIPSILIIASRVYLRMTATYTDIAGTKNGLCVILLFFLEDQTATGLHVYIM